MNDKEPLAFRVRPKTLEEYVGQEHVLGKDKILYRTIKADRLSSIILFGPPGCGNCGGFRVGPGGHHRGESPDAAADGSAGYGIQDGCLRAGQRPLRFRQGGGGPLHPPHQPPQPEALRGAQLCGHPGEPDGVRALRL